MKITVTKFLDELYELLKQGPGLVNLYNLKEFSFIPSLTEWLVQSESLLERYHRCEMTEIAGLRAQLLSASNGVHEKNSFYVNPSIKDKKLFYAIASILFNSAQNILNNIYNKYILLREDAEKYIKQIVMISLQKGTFNLSWDTNLMVTDRLTRLWQSFATDKDLVQGTRQILSSVHYLDALRILDEIITELKL